MQRSALILNRTRLSKRSRAHAYSSRLVTVPAGCNFHTKVQLKGSKQGVVRGFYDSLVQRFNSSGRHAPKQAVIWGFGGRVGVRLEIKEEGSVSASSDQDHSTQHPEDYN